MQTSVPQGFSGSGGHTFPRADADRDLATFVHDLMTLQAPEGQTRTGELRFTEALWYRG